jgi:hypothetical protein
MVFAFALLLGMSSIVVSCDTLLVSVGLYIVVPVLIAQAWRRALHARGQAAFDGAARAHRPVVDRGAARDARLIRVEQLEVVRERHRVAGVLQGARHLRERQHLARVTTPELEEPAHQGGFVQAGEHQHVTRVAAGQRVSTALAVGLTGRHTLVLLKDGTLRGWGNTDWG